jgi:hypothetical protein
MVLDGFKRCWLEAKLQIVKACLSIEPLWRELSHIFAAGDMASDSIVARLAPDAARLNSSKCLRLFISTSVKPIESPGRACSASSAASDPDFSLLH